MVRAFVDTFIASYDAPPKVIVLRGDGHFSSPSLWR